MPFEEGDLVPAGTLMATLDPHPYTDQVQQAAAATASTRISLNNALQLLKRREELIEGGGISIEDYENTLSSQEVLAAQLQESQAAWEVAKTNLGDTQVFAPNLGTILTRIREPGSVVKIGDPVYTLSLSAPVWIRAYITEPELGLVTPGMAVEIHTDTPQTPMYRGTVGFISPVAEFTPKTVETTQLRTDLVYRLRITAENPHQGLRQGMPVTIKIPLTQPS
jgi:HlyD family secretion protein